MAVPFKAACKHALNEQQHGWVGYLDFSEEEAELEGCQGGKQDQEKEKLGFCLQHLLTNFLLTKALWHLDRLLLLWGRVPCTVMFVLMPFQLLPSAYQTITGRWSYSRKCKVYVCQGWRAQRVRRGDMKRAHHRTLGAITYLPNGWGTGQVWQGRLFLWVSIVSSGATWRWAGQREVCKILNCWFQKPAPQRRQPLPRAVPPYPKAPGALAGMNSRSPKRNHRFRFSRGHCLCNSSRRYEKNMWDIGISAEPRDIAQLFASVTNQLHSNSSEKGSLYVSSYTSQQSSMGPRCVETISGRENFQFSFTQSINYLFSFLLVHWQGHTIQMFWEHGSKISVLDYRELYIKSPFRENVLCVPKHFYVFSVSLGWHNPCARCLGPCCVPLVHVEVKGARRDLICDGPRTPASGASPSTQKACLHPASETWSSAAPGEGADSMVWQICFLYIWDSHLKLFVWSWVQYLSWFGLKIIFSRQGEMLRKFTNCWCRGEKNLISIIPYDSVFIPLIFVYSAAIVLILIWILPNIINLWVLQ